MVGHDLDMSGRCLLITGGARRVGKAIALSLARSGAAIAIHYRNSRQAAEDLVDELRSLKAEAWSIQGDLADAAGLDSFFDDLITLTGGRLDGVVNNASEYPESRLQTVGLDEIEQSIRLHFFAPLVIARRLAELGKNADIINILDTRVTMYDREHLAYHIGKKMLESLTSMMALELAPKIKVNAVAPGAVLQTDHQSEDIMEHWAKFNPLQTHGNPDGVARCVRFLLTTEFITGQCLFYDGGYHLKAATYG